MRRLRSGRAQRQRQRCEIEEDEDVEGGEERQPAPALRRISPVLGYRGDNGADGKQGCDERARDLVEGQLAATEQLPGGLDDTAVVEGARRLAAEPIERVDHAIAEM